MNSVPQNSKTITPWIQAKDRMFNGNSRSVRTVPLKILTPVSGVLSFTDIPPHICEYVSRMDRPFSGSIFCSGIKAEKMV